MDSRLTLARVLLLAGLGVGLLSLRESIGHIGNPDFQVPGYAVAPTHSWYHVFREVCGDIAKMTVFLLLLFGRRSWRTPVTWWIGAILVIGYYAPFWIGEPFVRELAAPSRPAGIIHVMMATLSTIAFLVARPAFAEKREIAQ